MFEGYLSMIVLWSGDRIPSKWMTCEGQALPADDYQALCVLLGSNYDGDGHSTFKLPDLRDSVPAAGNKKLRYIICVEGIVPT